MRVLYPQWYINVGIRRKGDLIMPTIIDNDSFFLPKNSTLHFNTFSENLEGPTAKDSMFALEKRVYVQSVLKYDSTFPPTGQFRIASGVNYSAVIKALKTKRIKNSIVFMGDKAARVADNELLVFNYDTLMSAYKFVNNPFLLYNKWANSLNTIIANVNKNLNSTSRNQFILLEIPNSLPKVDKLKERAKMIDITRPTLEIFNTYKLLTFLELWRYIDPRYHFDSFFSRIDTDKLNRINLVLRYKDKYCVIGMDTLFHFANLYPLYKGDNKFLNKEGEPRTNIILENEFKVKITSADFKQARAALILLFKTIVNREALTYAEAENTADLDLRAKQNPKQNIMLDSAGKINTIALKALANNNSEDAELDEETIIKLSEDYDMPEVELPDMPIPDNDDFIEVDEEDINFEDYENIGDDEEVLIIEEEAEEADETLDINKIINDDESDRKVKTLDKIKVSLSLGEMSKNMADSLIDIVENQLENSSPYMSENKTLKEMMTIEESDIILKEKSVKIPSINTKLSTAAKGALNKEEQKELEDVLSTFEIYNQNPLGELDRQYVEKLHKKFLVSSVYKLQDAGLIISNYTVQEDKDTLGDYEIHRIETVTLKGKKNTNTIKIPKLALDGTYKQSGVAYRLRKQIADK